MDKRLNPNLVWVFALVAAGLCFGVLKANIVHSNKAFSAVCFVIFGGMAMVSTLFTEARTAVVIGAFSAGAAVWGVLVYVTLHSAAAAITKSFGGGDIPAAAKTVIYTWSALYFLAAFAAGISGAIFGRRAQGQLSGATARR